MRYQKKAYATATSELHGSVIQYAPLVRRLAYQIASRLPPNVELDDLIQDGMMGLLVIQSKPRHFLDDRRNSLQG